MLIVAILLTSVGLEAEIEIALEAELADVILAPMVVADDELASDGKLRVGGR
jgi:hypothetical protein